MKKTLGPDPDCLFKKVNLEKIDSRLQKKTKLPASGNAGKNIFWH